MNRGYDFGRPDPEDELADLDEYVTEYLDGTMDPAVQEAFEEYLEANPHLLEYVCCLNDVRCALQDLNCSCQAPSGVQAKLRRRVSGDMVAEECGSRSSTAERLGTLTLAATALVIMSVGALWLYPSSGGIEGASGSEVASTSSEAAAARSAPVVADDPGRSELSSPVSTGGGVLAARSSRFAEPRASAASRHGSTVDAPTFRPPTRIPSGVANAMVRQSEAAPQAHLLSVSP